MQIFSLSAVCVIVCMFATNPTCQQSRLRGARLGIAAVCSLAERALMRGAEEQLIVCGVYVAREANLEGRQYTSMQQPGNLPPHIISGFFIWGRAGVHGGHWNWILFHYA